MNKFLPEGLVIASFRPHAAEFTAMDDITIVIEDISLVTKWHGLVCIQHMVDSETLKGFHLIGAKHLRGKRQTTFVPLLLLRAFYFDVLSKQHQHSFRSLCRLYVGPAWLLIRHPSIRWLDS
jgi:hypothetical protein